MTLDPTTEIKRIRHQLGADDGYDLDRIFDRLRKLRSESGRTFVCGSPRKPADNKPLQRSGEAGVFEMENLTSPPAER